MMSSVPQLAWVLFLLSIKSPANRLIITQLRRTTLLPLAHQLDNAEASQSSLLMALEKQEQLSKQAAAASKGASGRGKATAAAAAASRKGYGASGTSMAAGHGMTGDLLSQDDQLGPMSPPSYLGGQGTSIDTLPVSTRAREAAHSRGGSFGSMGGALSSGLPFPVLLPEITPAEGLPGNEASSSSAAADVLQHGHGKGDGTASVMQQDGLLKSGYNETPGMMDGPQVSPLRSLRSPGNANDSGGFLTPSITSVAHLQPYKINIPTPSSETAAPQSVGSVSSVDSLGSPWVPRKGTFSDDEDWELAMICKEVAMLERTSVAVAPDSGKLPGTITPRIGSTPNKK